MPTRLQTNLLPLLARLPPDTVSQRYFSEPKHNLSLRMWESEFRLGWPDLMEIKHEVLARVDCAAAASNRIRHGEHREGRCGGVLCLCRLSLRLCGAAWGRTTTSSGCARGCARSGTAWNAHESWWSGQSRWQA